MARTGLRMMPTFPLPPLKFRTAGFPRYGFKAGISDAAFPASWFAIALRALRFHRDSLLCVRDDALMNTSVRADSAALPQGPSLRSGLFCPDPSSLTGPIRPCGSSEPSQPLESRTSAVSCWACYAMLWHHQLTMLKPCNYVTNLALSS